MSLNIIRTEPRTLTLELADALPDVVIIAIAPIIAKAVPTMNDLEVMIDRSSLKNIYAKILVNITVNLNSNAAIVAVVR